MSPVVRNWLLAFTALVIIGAVTGCGITAPSYSAGYADYEVKRYKGMERDASFSLGPVVMRFAANHVDDDPATKELLKSIDGVRVSVYQLNRGIDREALSRDMSDAARELTDDDWQAIVQVREDGETVHVLLKEDGEHIVGITVLTADSDEFVFVNVMGDISPRVLAEISGHVPGGDALSLAASDWR